MNEYYLHYIWKMGRLPFHQLQLTDGTPISILQRGEYNELFNGPDFQNALISNEGIQWAGPVEMHVKSSDWYKHLHHLDKNYDNVVLHVVLEHDKEIIQNGRQLPTLELKSFIDWKHVEKYNRMQLNTGKLPICASFLKDIDFAYIKNMIDRAINKRMNRKASLFNEEDSHLTFLYFIAQAFGSNYNKEAFVMLLRLVHEKRFELDQRLFVNTVLSIAFDAQNEGIFSWRKRGFRPVSNIEKRIEQFAKLIFTWDDSFLEEIKGPNAKQVLTDWFIRAAIKDDFLQQQILINAFAPFKHKMEQVEMSGQSAFELLESLKPENNAVMRLWKEVGVVPKNALESQGLLEIYQQFCKNKCCLSCSIGMKILNR